MSSWADKGWMGSKELIRHCSNTRLQPLQPLQSQDHVQSGVVFFFQSFGVILFLTDSVNTPPCWYNVCNNLLWFIHSAEGIFSRTVPSCRNGTWRWGCSSWEHSCSLRIHLLPEMWRFFHSQIVFQLLTFCARWICSRSLVGGFVLWSGITAGST